MHAFSTTSSTPTKDTRKADQSHFVQNVEIDAAKEKIAKLIAEENNTAKKVDNLEKENKSLNDSINFFLRSNE